MGRGVEISGRPRVPRQLCLEGSHRVQQMPVSVRQCGSNAPFEPDRGKAAKPPSLEFSDSTYGMRDAVRDPVSERRTVET